MKLISRALLAQDLRRQPKRWQLVLLSCQLLIAVFVSWLVPRLMPAVLQFLNRVFKMESLTDVVLLNDYLSLYMLVYWLIVFEAFALLVIPAEEGYLSLFLSKPISRRQYLLTRLLPILALAAVQGLILSLGSAGVILLLNDPADFSWGRYLAGSGICLSLGLLMAMIVQLALLRLKETSSAMLLAFVCWIMPILPGSLLMYRPDLFTANPGLRWWIVFPANLIWLKNELIPLALGLVPVLLILSGGLIWMASDRLERQDLG